MAKAAKKKTTRKKSAGKIDSKRKGTATGKSTSKSKVARNTATKKALPKKKAVSKKKAVGNKKVVRKKIVGQEKPSAIRTAKTEKKIPTSKVAKKKSQSSSSPAKKKISNATGKRIQDPALLILNDLYPGGLEMADIFHRCSLFLKEKLDFVFLNLYLFIGSEKDRYSGMNQCIIAGIHETDSTFFAKLDKNIISDHLSNLKDIFNNTFESSVGSVPSIATNPFELPIYGIEDEKPSLLRDLQASSAILIPISIEERMSGLLVCAIQQPRPDYEESALVQIEAMMPLLKLIVRIQGAELAKLLRQRDLDERGVQIRRLERTVKEEKSRVEEALSSGESRLHEQQEHFHSEMDAEKQRNASEAQDLENRLRENLLTEFSQKENQLTTDNQNLQEKLNQQASENAEASRREKKEIIENLETGHNEQIQELKNLHLQTSRELDSIRSTRESEITELKNNYESRILDLDANLGERTSALHQSEDELKKARTTVAEYKDSHDELKNSYLSKIQQADQKTGSMRENLEKERIEKQAILNDLRKELQEARTKLDSSEDTYLQELGVLENSLRETKEKYIESSVRIPELEDKNRKITEENGKLHEKLSMLQRTNEELDADLKAVSIRLTQLQSDTEKERQKFQNESEKLRTEGSAAILRLQKDLETSSEDLNRMRSRENGLRSELDSLRNKSETLQQKLGDAQKREQSFRTEISNFAQKEARLHSDVDESLEIIEAKENEIKTLQETETGLKDDIGVHRGNETRLKQAIAALEEEKRTIAIKESEEAEKNKDLRKSLDESLNNCTTLKSEIIELNLREKKMSEDLNASLSREKGSKAAGKLIVDITYSLSNISGLSDKVKYIRENSIPGTDFKRVLLFSFMDEDRMKFEAGFWEDEPLAIHRNIPINIRETAFGDAIATGRPETLHIANEKDLRHPDMPELLYDRLCHEGSKDIFQNDRIQSFVFLPLIESKRVIGLLTFGWDTNRPLAPDRIQLLEQISPLMAVALRYEKNREMLQKADTARDYSDQVHAYLESRFADAMQELMRFSEKKSDPSTESEVENSTADLRLEPASTALSSILPPARSMPEDAATGDEFMQWMHELGERAADRCGLAFDMNLNAACLGELKSHLGPAFHNLYWISQEAVDNVILHSQSSSLRIELLREEESFRFLIEDDGEGIVRTTGSENPTGSRGLQSMRSLIGDTGGLLSLERPREGHGLAVVITWQAPYRKIPEMQPESSGNK